MKTSRPFSTISYNTDKFLVSSLNKMLDEQKISFWLYVVHLPEEDESRKHKHLYIVPNGSIDTDAFRNDLIEVVDCCDKPLQCMPCRYSKFYDAYLYFLHDEKYLSSKGMTRKYHYQFQDFVYKDYDYFHELIAETDFSKFNRLQSLIDSIDKGQTFSDLIRSGVVPINLITQYYCAYQVLYNSYWSKLNVDGVKLPVKTRYKQLSALRTCIDPKITSKF